MLFVSFVLCLSVFHCVSVCMGGSIVEVCCVLFSRAEVRVFDCLFACLLACCLHCIVYCVVVV